MRVLHPRTLVVSLVIAACTGDDERPTAPAVASDTTRPGVVTALQVNTGQRGMIAMARWMLPTDGHAILVVEDWSSIEAEPFFDGFLFASESTGLVVRVDSVWDAVPSPDWSRIAFGSATFVRGGEAEEIPSDSFIAVAERLGVTVEDARAAAFPASGMAIMAGLAQLGIADGGTGETRLLPLLAGWRVQWTAEGKTVLAGRGPLRASDDAPPTRWIEADAATGAVLGPAEPDTLTQLDWVTGPTIDVSVDPDTGRIEIPVEGGVVVSDSGRITLRSFPIGPGIALAATRRGCFIAALVPDSAAGEYDPKHRLMVYDTGCRR